MDTPHRAGAVRGTAGSLAGPAPVRLDEAVSEGARRVAAGFAEPRTTRTREEWLGVVGHCQALINTLTAVQDAAIAEAARRESVWCEDGTLGETVHAPGRVSLDAADLVAPLIGASHAQAQRRVEQAVRLAAGRAPVPAETRETPRPAAWARCTRPWPPGSSTGTAPAWSRSSRAGTGRRGRRHRRRPRPAPG